jgi:polyhydroxyalkanoate synthase subunit PhaC
VAQLLHEHAAIGRRQPVRPSTNGHIAALINPPNNPKSSYQVADTHPADPDAWAAAARTEPGSWWPDYVGWLIQRGGEHVAPPAAAQAVDAAPGRYVLET